MEYRRAVSMQIRHLSARNRTEYSMIGLTEPSSERSAK
jgi:hypothetical protein